MGDQPSRPPPRTTEPDGRRERRHGVDLECDRQAQRRLESGDGCGREQAGLPAQSRDLRAAAAATRWPSLRQQRPHHRPGRLVRPACARREGKARGGRRDLSRFRHADATAEHAGASSGTRLRRRVSEAGLSHGPTMTSLPANPSAKKLGLVIDLDICVDCHACAVNCKEWNTGGHMAPLTDRQPYGADPLGVWFNRVHTFEAGDGADGRTVHFPRSCLHCEQPACVEVCPTGASYKRAEDGIVLVNENLCIGCKLCSWACPYGAREYDYDSGTMKKCTLCIDRIYNENLEEIDRVPACVATCPAHARHFGDLGDPDSYVSKIIAERGGYDLMPEMGYAPVNKYLPPRPRQTAAGCTGALPALEPVGDSSTANAVLRWIDRLLSR